MLAVWVFAGCSGSKKDPFYAFQNGTIHVSVDESFRPVIEEQIKVFETSFPGAKIIAEYKTEANCLKDFFYDTANSMAIITRGLGVEEENYWQDSLGHLPSWNVVAYDAITLIVNKNNPDTLFTIEKLRLLLSGKGDRKQKLIFDGLNSTSTVRFISDSILKGRSFDTSVVKAVKNSQEVVNYIANNENAVGFVGISWVGNPEDSEQMRMLDKVKIAYVACDVCSDTPYVKPLQSSILTRRYPLVRGLYFVHKDGTEGLARGFSNFLRSERGQLIFKRAYLGTVMDFEVRNVKLTKKL